MKNRVSRGEIWLFDPDPVRGTEVGEKIRPGLIISNDAMNHGPSGRTIVIPMTTTQTKIACHIEITPHDGPVRQTCYAMCDQIRTVSRHQLVKRWGKLENSSLMRAIEQWISDILDIPQF